MFERPEAESGFTLVELLVVVVILGVLAAIVVFAVGGIADRGSNSAAKTDESYLQAAEEANFAKQSVYVSESDLKTNGLLRTASTRNMICWNATNYFVTAVSGDVTAIAQSAANTSCATEATAQGLAGSFTGSLGTTSVP